jgi:hypothetical protein
MSLRSPVHANEGSSLNHRQPVSLLVELRLNGVHSQQRTPELDDVLIMRRGDQFPLAKNLGEKAVAEYEGQLKEVTLSALTGDQLKAVDGLGNNGQ